MQMASKHMRRCSVSLVIKEMQIKTVVTHQLEWLKFLKLTVTTNYWPQSW